MTRESGFDLYLPLRRAGAKHTDRVDNDTVILDQAIGEGIALWDEGLLAGVPDLLELRQTWLMQKYQARARSVSRQINQWVQLYGQDPQHYLDLGDDYDEVLVVCNAETLNEFFVTSDFDCGRKTTLGAFTADDAELMLKQREINVRKQTRALELERPGYLQLAHMLRPFTNYRGLRAAVASDG